MKHPDQTSIVYNKIKADSGLNESALAILGVELTAEFVNSRTFQEIEQYILDKKKNESKAK